MISYVNKLKNVPSAIFMQICAAITEKCILSYSSVNTTDNGNRTSDATCLPLVAANNTTINTYGKCIRVVDVGLKQDYAWTFIVADVKQPIIGADFLIHYSLLVDLKSRCLRDMRTGLAIPATLSSIKPLSLNRVDTVQNDYTKLLGQFPELTHPTTKGEPVKHNITHKIVTKGHSVFARPRRLAPDKLVNAKREFDDMRKLLNPATVSGRQRFIWCLRKTETADRVEIIEV